MALSPEILKIIERCGAAFCKPVEVSRLCGIKLSVLNNMLLDEESPAYEAYYRGLENSKLALKETTISIAKQGSSPAQTLAFSLLKDLESELD